MAVPVARVHLKMAHAALPALLPTPCAAAAAILAKPPPAKAKPSRADADGRWDAHKAKKSGSSSTGSSASSSPARSVFSSAGRGSWRKNATSLPSPPTKPGRADSAERWDAHKKTASTSSAGSISSSKWAIVSRASSGERWDVHKIKHCPAQAKLLDDGDSSTTGSNDVDMEEEEIVWKPRAMYAGPGFATAAPEPSKLPVPTALFVQVA